MVPNSNNLIVLEWDREELRYLWAGQAARRLVIRAIGRVRPDELGKSSDEPAAESIEPTFEALLAELKQRLRAKNSRAVIVLPRGDIEEFEATLPPASEDELSGLVVNEAHKHLANADEARMDFLEVERGSDETRRLSIMALPQPSFSRLNTAVKHQGWALASLQVRHVAAAGLLRKLVDLEKQPRSILVNINRQDVELLIFELDRLILVRTISLSADNDAAALADRLAVEIQRSLMVTARAESDQSTTPDQIYIFGGDTEQETLAERLSANLQLPAALLNPLDVFVAYPKDLPPQLHQFSGLLGALIEQPAERTVDLLNSKCGRPKSPWLRRAIIYGSAAAVALFGTIWWGLDAVNQLKDSNATLKAELTKLEKQFDQLSEKTAIVDQIATWQVDDINWLDELRELSQRFPERSLVQVKSMTLSSSPANPGVIVMNLQAKDENVITKMEQTIRDEFHQVRTNQFSQSDSEEELPWQFGASILLSRRDREEFSMTPGAKPASEEGDSAEVQAASPPKTDKSDETPPSQPPATDTSNGGGRP